MNDPSPNEEIGTRLILISLNFLHSPSTFSVCSIVSNNVNKCTMCGVQLLFSLLLCILNLYYTMLIVLNKFNSIQFNSIQFNSIQKKKGRMVRHRPISEETTSWRLRQNEERSWEIARTQKREPLRVESSRKTVGGVRKGLTPIWRHWIQCTYCDPFKIAIWGRKKKNFSIEVHNEKVSV